MMIKHVIVVILLGSFFWSCSENQKTSVSTEIEVEQNKEAENNFISLADFDQKAGKFVNKPVVVQGIVDHLCKHGGKKLLLVSEVGDVHVYGEERFAEEMTGSELKITGMVSEFRVDEAYCFQMEEDNIQEHREGKIDKEYYESVLEDIKYYRDSMKQSGSDHLSYYSLDYVSHEEVK